MQEQLNKIDDKIEKLIDSINEIQRQIDKSEVNLTSELAIINRRMDIKDDIILKIDTKITGNGKDGILLRLDRIEQIELNRKWSMRIIWTSIIGMVSKLIIDFLR